MNMSNARCLEILKYVIDTVEPQDFDGCLDDPISSLDLLEFEDIVQQLLKDNDDDQCV